MNIRHIYALVILIVAGFTNSFAQTPVELHIAHKLGGATDFAFNKMVKNDVGNDFDITRIEYYISKISITHDGGMITDIPNHYILVNGTQNVIDNLGSFSITSVEAVSFHIGVDTPINHADPSLQPMGHPLAPKSPSMHWGWVDGYRFVAIEGNEMGSTPAQRWEVHALGDKHYMKTTVNVSGQMKGGKLIIPLHADYLAALKGIDLTGGLIAHGDGTNEALLLNNFKNNVFSAGFPVSVSTTVATTQQVTVYPNPSFNKEAFITFGNNQEQAQVTVVDVQGRTVTQVQKHTGDNNIKIQLNNAGLYFVKIRYSDGSFISRKLQIQ